MASSLGVASSRSFLPAMLLPNRASRRNPASPSSQVLGVEALITKEVRNTHKLLIDHINALRQIPELANMRAVMALESNLAFESQHILHAMTAAGMKMVSCNNT
jgi:hypothetical protein